MDQLETLPIVASAVAAAVGAYALGWGARIAAPRLGFCDKPDNVRKLHSQATPLMGGVAVTGGMLAGLGGGLLLLESQAASLAAAPWLASLLISALAMCALGLWDDRWPLRPRIKLLWQIAACLPFVAWGANVDAVALLGWEVPLGGWGSLVALLWLLACVNATNLLDGADGVASAFGMTVALGLMILSPSSQGAILAVALAGALLGFLIHNWPPAKIFLGDAGSLTLGLLLGGMTLIDCAGQGRLSLAPAAALMSIAFLDTFAAIGRRALSGAGVAAADRHHLHHCLQACGLSRWETACFIGCATAMTVAGAVAAAVSGVDAAAVVICAALAGQLAVARLFGRREVTLLLHRARRSAAALPAPAAPQLPPMLLPTAAPSPPVAAEPPLIKPRRRERVRTAA